MTDRQQDFSGLKEVGKSHQFSLNKLDNFLKSELPNFSGIKEIKQFKGGQSNPTYLIKTYTKSFVLRRKPTGDLLKSAHAVDREFEVIKSLKKAGFPVPTPYLLCKDESIIGTIFYIMEFIQGRIFWDPDMPDCSKEERKAIYDDLNKNLAKLHDFNHESIGLSDFGVPGNYFSRQISRWTKQYRLSETKEISAMDNLISWLPNNIPEDDDSSVVHGDYRLDNVIIHPTEPRIIGILDWELSTIGHPLGDFTYHLLTWQLPDIGIGSGGFLGKNLNDLGIPNQEDYIDQYCERTGRVEGIENRGFYFAYNFFRLAAILQGIAGRVRDGTASNKKAKKLIHAIEPLADIGWQHTL